VPRLVLGPVLRYAGEREATVWVEADAACEVEVLGHSAPTFCVEGHHYALVVVRGLEPGGVTEYQVSLDGERVWPEPGSEFPASVIRTVSPGQRLEIVFGSCRVAVPHEPPYTLTKDEDPRGREVDAIYALAMRMQDLPRDEWPNLLLWVGDQVYADEVSPGALQFIRSRRDVREPPGEEVADFEEYTRLYWDSWTDPALRWILSTVPSAMIFDDHDVHDDWNTSEEWVAEMRAKPWWNRRIVGAFMSYWIYQHIGNLSPDELDEDTVFCDVRDAGDGTARLREFAFLADRETAGTRWSFCRDLGSTRIIVLDSRAGRVLEPGNRSMLDDAEYEWVSEHTRGDFDHLVFATTLPILLSRAMHWFEAWNEKVCEGAWGSAFAGIGERIRQGLDLEHWGAFEKSFQRVTGLMQELGSGRRGRPPATITTLSGDVHHAYLAEVGFRRGSGVKSAVYQAVSSPFRNPLDSRERAAIRISSARATEALTRLLARSAGVQPLDLDWRFVQDATFDNQVGTLEIDGREATLRIERALPGDDGGPPALETTLERRLA
jgi:PhoD-like phosphatase